MAERGSREPASTSSSIKNALDIALEEGLPQFGGRGTTGTQNITLDLRKELLKKGLKGFKRGGKVKKTGVYKLHKGEKVQTAKQAKKAPARSAAARLRGKRI